MNKIENSLVELIKNSLVEKYQLEDVDNLVMIEIPKDKANGDYSTNVAMRLAKLLKKAPIEIAKDLQEILSKSDLLEQVLVAPPGFINFIVNKGELSGVISNVLKNDSNYGSQDKYKDIKICVEYVSVNPTGDIHPGHARGAAVGDSLTRMLKKLGYNVTREYYVNDAGNQIDNLGRSIYVRYHELFGEQMELPEDGYHGTDIIDIAKSVKEGLGSKYKDIPYEDCKTFFKEYGTKFELAKLKKDLDLYRVSFDVWTSEKTLYERNLVSKAIDTLNANDMLYEKDGATWLKTTKYNDDKDRVIKKSDGSLTYLTPDIAYHLDKFDRGHDKLIDILGADHHGYVPRLKAAINALGKDANNLDVIIIQMVRLIKDGEEFKLSKRSGKAIALRDIIEEAGVDACRYFFVSKAPNTQMDFDIDMATKQSNDNPVYYVQYAHARMCSILKNDVATYEIKDSYELIKEEKETLLLKHLNEFPAVIEECVVNKEPHRMCNYVYKLAQLFHSFYNECKVVDATNLELTKQRLALVKACEIVLKEALNLIGVEAPEKM